MIASLSNQQTTYNAAASPLAKQGRPAAKGVNMRLVDELSKIDKCQNCGSIYLLTCSDRLGVFKYCTHYLEEHRERQSFAELVKIDETEKAPAKEQLVQELREEVDNLRWCVWDAKSDQLVGNITSIFNKLIEYIENN